MRRSLVILIHRCALISGAPVLLAACTAGATLTPDELLVQGLALINGGQSTVAAVPGAADPVLQVSISSVNGSNLCHDSCPAQTTVAPGHVNLELVCRSHTTVGTTTVYALKVAADVMAGHVYELTPAAKPEGCQVAVTDVTRRLEKAKSADNPGIRG
jgi:hypothetical protein